ncbi:TPA: hypothetical protein RQ636_001127 [Pseudomonas aeruginosa]|nr:hypothetical protein [Pseudomonas aeruginosa]
MITNNSKASSCTCPSGDDSLVHPCPAHPASVKQAGGDERAAFEAWATHLPMDRQYLRPDLYMPPTQWAWDTWQARAALVQPSPAPTLRAAIDVANDRFEVPVAKWGTDLAGEKERPEVVAIIHERTGTIANADMVRAMEEGSVPSGYTGDLISEKLERCGALLAARAEIERLDRAAASQGEGNTMRRALTALALVTLVGLATVAAGAALQPFKTLFIWEVCR